MKGRLATINTFDEDVFLHGLIANESAIEYWVGGFQEANVNCVPPDPAPEPRCGWKWINGELIDPDNNTGLNYTNWAPGEPNNTSPGENHLAIGRFPQIGWNDEGSAPNLIAGYIVEYGDTLAPVAGDTCKAPAQCPLGTIQSLQLPAGAVTANNNITVSTFPINVACGRDTPLSLFNGDVIVPAYLCGNAVFVKTVSNVQINRDVVFFVNQDDDNPFGCDDPISQVLGPTLQDAMPYQANNPADVLEGGFVTGVNPRFVGTFHDFLVGCINPPRGSGGKGSYFAKGLFIDPGLGNDFATNPAGNHMFMVELQSFKLQVLRSAVLQAKPFLKTVDWLALRVLIEAAIAAHNHQLYNAELLKIRLLLALNDKVKFTLVPGKNPHGEIKYRALNAQDMVRRRIIPFAP